MLDHIRSKHPLTITATASKTEQNKEVLLYYQQFSVPIGTLCHNLANISDNSIVQDISHINLCTKTCKRS